MITPSPPDLQPPPSRSLNNTICACFVGQRRHHDYFLTRREIRPPVTGHPTAYGDLIEFFLARFTPVVSNGKRGSRFWQLCRLRSTLSRFQLFFSLLVLVVSAISRSRERGRDVRASFVILIRSSFELFSLFLSFSVAIRTENENVSRVFSFPS